MKHLYALVMMQLKDKLDFKFLKDKKKLISKIVFTLLKFLIVGAVALVLFKVLPLLIFFNGIPQQLMIFIFGIIFVLSVLSCTVGLMKTLYFADDNKVLVTFPVNANVLFASRLIVYYVFELKRSLFLSIPIFIAFGINASMAWYYYIWLFVAFIFISAIPVLVGALLSIPAMFVYMFIKKRPVLLAACYVAAIAVVVFIAVKLIGLIPEEINLIEQGGTIERYVLKFLYACEDKFYPVNMIITMLTGRSIGFRYNLLIWDVPKYFGYTLGLLAVTGGLAFVSSRPLFFTMISKTIEFEKIPPKNARKNIKRSRFGTFLNAETSALIRSREIGTFVIMYIVVPVMVYLLNKVFMAMDTNLTGVYMVYAFNLLIMILPMLASDAVVATLYSREGRAAYVKKTMPLNPIVPLIMKLVPLFIASAASLIASAVIFSNFIDLTVWQVVLICISLIGIQWGHILWSGMSDLMNPKNEQYATSGEMNDNPNESFSTISAFIVSIIYALYAFMLFPEGVTSACIKLCLMGVAFCAVLAYMYVQKIKVYYYEK